MFVHPSPTGVNTLWYMNLQRTKRPALRALRKRQMEQLGYRSVDEIADKAKVVRNTIYNWEAGFSPALEELDRVAAALDLPLSAMVDAWSGRTHEEAPPAEASGAVVDEFLERWRTADAPEWAQGLANNILSAVERDRTAFLDLAAKQYAAIAELLLRGPDSDDAAPPQIRGPRPKRPGPPRGQST